MLLRSLDFIGCDKSTQQLWQVGCTDTIPWYETICGPRIKNRLILKRFKA